MEVLIEVTKFCIKNKKERKERRLLFCFHANNKEVEEYGFVYILIQNVVKNYVSSFELKKQKKWRLKKMGFALYRLHHYGYCS